MEFKQAATSLGSTAEAAATARLKKNRVVRERRVKKMKVVWTKVFLGGNGAIIRWEWY